MENYVFDCIFFMNLQAMHNKLWSIYKTMQTVPVNSVARFTCRTTSFVVWQINGAQLSSDNAEVFKQRGITVEYDQENESVLLVNATLRNNATTILCRTGLDHTSLNVTSEMAVLTVFGE